VYEAVEKEYPEDLECLTYLQVTRDFLQPLTLLTRVQRICSDLGMMERANRYSELLAKAERKADKQVGKFTVLFPVCCSLCVVEAHSLTVAARGGDWS
jgi:hypothetical protein